MIRKLQPYEDCLAIYIILRKNYFQLDNKISGQVLSSGMDVLLKNTEQVD